MAGQVTYPSAQFPGYPSVSVDCPDGWVPFPTPAAPLAVALEVEPGVFRANVVLAIARLEPGSTLAQVEETIARTLAGLPGYTRAERAVVEVDGRPGFRIEGSFTDPQVGVLVQAVQVLVVEHDGATDVIQLTGTCAASQVESVFAGIRDLQESVVIR